MTNARDGRSSGTTQLLDGNVVGAIVTDESQLNKQARLRLIRALRSDRDWQLIYQHRVRMSAYLNNVLQFPGGEA